MAAGGFPRTHSVLLFVLLLTAGGLAGCIGGGTEPPAADATMEWQGMLSVPRFGAILEEDLWIDAADGIRLHGTVFRPDTTRILNDTLNTPAAAIADDGSWRAPTILILSPYFGTLGETTDTKAGYTAWMIDWFVPRGYAIAKVNVRGTHLSEGCMVLGGQEEVQDGYAIVEHLASQPWSNGRVGMYGVSYDGTTANAAAVANPPHLTTIVPVSAISEWYRYMYYQGAKYQGNTLTIPLFTAIGAQPQFLLDDPLAIGLLADSLCEQDRNNLENLDPSRDYTDWWHDRDYLKDVENINASVLFVHGLGDWNVKTDHVHNFYNAIPAPKKAWLGLWAHSNAERDGFVPELHRWFDHWLLAIDTGVMDEPAVQVQDTSGAWRNETDWPPTRAENTTFYFRADPGTSNRLSQVPPNGPRANRTYTADPTGELAGLGLASTQVRFVSDPLLLDLHYAGTPDILLHANVDGQNTVFVFNLYEVDRYGEWHWTNRGFLDAAHRDSLEDGTPLDADRDYAFRIPLYPKDHVFPAGTSIGIEIRGDDPGILSEPALTDVTLRISPEQPSSIVFPTLPQQA